MSNVKIVHWVNGGCVVEFEDGYLQGIVAYENGEESCQRWADMQHVLLNSLVLVCGWEQVDEKLLEYGYEHVDFFDELESLISELCE